ncbi:MAG: putative glycosyltransferase, partial [Rhodospirillales bacterium]|nr:putative glycosyltransferase [Rhodospirillales bacterium]
MKKAAAADRTHTFRGSLDTVSREKISGWAFDSATPKAQVAIVVSANDQMIWRGVAGQLRPDLAMAGIGDGFHAFTLDIAGKLRDDVGYQIDVTRESDGRPLDNSPAMLEPGAAEPAGLEGCLDTLTRTRLSGWAVDGDNHVGLVVTANGHVIANILANRYRADLKDAGYGDGRHAFDVILPELSALIEHEIHVRRQADGAELPGSPLILAAAGAFDDNAQATFATLLAGIDSDSNEAKASAFLAKQMDLLLARRADRESGRAAREARNLHRRRWGMLAKDDPVAASLSAPSARALVIDDKVPAAGRDAGSVAILSHMRALKALGYNVAFVAARAMEDSAGAAQLEDAEGVACYGAPFYASVEDVLNRQSGSFSVVYLHRLSNAGDYAALVRTHQPKARIIYSVADLHHLRVARQSQVQQRSELAAFSRHLAFREFVAARFADAVITHSPVEAKMLAEKVQPAKVHVVPW